MAASLTQEAEEELQEDAVALIQLQEPQKGNHQKQFHKFGTIAAMVAIILASIAAAIMIGGTHGWHEIRKYTNKIPIN